MDLLSNFGSLTGTIGKALFLGQLASFFQAFAGFCSSLLASRGVELPISQSFFNYVVLSLVYGSIMIRRRRKLALPWYWYLLIGFLDVQANFLLNKAYQLSPITSVTLLVCLGVPWVVILTWSILGTRYSILQLVGTALCLSGIALVLFSDSSSDSGGGGSMPLVGDTLVIGATIFFALANVSEEFAIRTGDGVELLSMIGIFGLLFSFVEVLIFESDRLRSTNWSINSVLVMLGYVLIVFCMYSLAPYILEYSGATLLNLSYLTSNIWAVALRFFFYRQKVGGLYFLAVAVVIVGLAIYSWKEKDSTPCVDEENSSLEYHQLQDDDETSGRKCATKTVSC